MDRRTEYVARHEIDGRDGSNGRTPNERLEGFENEGSAIRNSKADMRGQTG